MRPPSFPLFYQKIYLLHISFYPPKLLVTVYLRGTNREAQIEISSARTHTCSMFKQIGVHVHCIFNDINKQKSMKLNRNNNNKCYALKRQCSLVCLSRQLTRSCTFPTYGFYKILNKHSTARVLFILKIIKLIFSHKMITFQLSEKDVYKLLTPNYRGSSFVILYESSRYFKKLFFHLFKMNIFSLKVIIQKAIKSQLSPKTFNFATYQNTFCKSFMPAHLQHVSYYFAKFHPTSMLVPEISRQQTPNYQLKGNTCYS